MFLFVCYHLSTSSGKNLLKMGRATKEPLGACPHESLKLTLKYEKVSRKGKISVKTAPGKQDNVLH